MIFKKLSLFLLVLPGIVCAPMRAKPLEKGDSATASPEQVVINEIKSILQGGAFPKKAFTEWTATTAPVLKKSEKTSLNKAGTILENLRSGKTGTIDGWNVLPTFEKAVQEYYPDFHIKTIRKPIIITKGTYWYLTHKK